MHRMRVNKVKFGKYIAARRESIRGIHTQSLLAEKLSVSTGTIGKIEAGERLPSFDLFIDLADVLLMTPGELMMVMAERENKEFLSINPLEKETLDKFIQLALEYLKASPNLPESPIPPRRHNPGPDYSAGKESALKEHRERVKRQNKPSQELSKPELSGESDSSV